jgi:uracil-DNA glycosylase family 4
MTAHVLVGEAPGEREVIEGKPFVGRAGKRLNQALSLAGVDRRGIYITNTVLCHPEGNATPPNDAVEACHERLIVEVRLRMPKKILAAGRVAGRALTGSRKPIEELRTKARIHSAYFDDSSEVRVTYHPSALGRDHRWPGWFDDDVRWLRD